MDQRTPQNYLQRLLITVGVIGLFVILVLLLWLVIDVLLLLFLAVLLAVALRTLAKPVARYTPITGKWALITILLGLVALVGMGGWLFIPELVSQTNQFVERIGDAENQVQGVLNQYGWGGQFLGNLLDQDETGQFLNMNMLSRLTGTFAQTFGILANVIFVLLTAVFVALDPSLYRNGLISLVPPRGRDRAAEVIHEVVKGLRSWLLGRVISMAAIGLAIWIGLFFLSIPLALVLGILTGLLEFIPVVGPFLSAFPAILIALTVGPMPALYTALLYLVMQQIEGNILTPVVQQQVVSLPPALTLTAVLVMGFLFGPLGVLVATPVLVVVFIMVKMLYLQDVLGSNRRAAQV